jgi:prepilin-type processing-associated H-X9-DG protein
MSWNDPPYYPVDGMFRINQPIRFEDIKDGTSETMLLGEYYHYDPIFDQIQNANWGPMAGNTWLFEFYEVCFTSAPLNYRDPPIATTYTPYDFTNPQWYAVWDLRTTSFGSGHPGGANFCMADGSVRFIVNEVSQLTYQRLSTIAAGDVPGDW